MRWIHIDDWREVAEGESAEAVRTIPSDLDFLRDHYPSFPLMPHSLLIESMAQTGGILVGKIFGFERDVILAKIDRAEFVSVTRPGDRLRIHARIEEKRDEGARVACRIIRGEDEVARATLFFALLGEGDAGKLGARGFVFAAGVLAQFSVK
jgi:3-hydroxyacyl-[acyl-carrier-protein] dehydratase